MSRVLVILILLAAISVLLGHEALYHYLSDDAFISFRYAQNFLHGHGLVYNVGERVEGYTNFLWVMVLSLLARFGLEMVVTARVLGAVLSILILLAVFIFGRSQTQNSIKGLLAPFLLALNAAFAVWALSGLETSLFALFVTLGAFAIVKERERERRFPLSALWFALAALTRPEGVYLFWCSWIFSLIVGLREKRGFRILNWLLFSGLIFGVIYFPYFFWRWSYYGYLFPNTFYVKTGGGVYQYIRGMFYVLKFITGFGGFLVFCLPFGVLLLSKPPEWVKVFAFLCLVWVAYVVWVGGDGLVCSRFFVPILPLIYLLIQEGLGAIVDKLDLVGFKRVVLMCFLILGVGAGTLSPTLNIRRDPYTEVIKEREMVANLSTIGRWLKENTGPDASIATNVAGAMPYYAEIKAVDMLGLNDLHIAHKKIEGMGRGSAGHEKRDFDYILSLKPTYIMQGWPTLAKEERDTSFTYDGVTYFFVSLKFGNGKIFQDFELKQGDLWFNAWQRVGP